jgi:hypothetical protein
MSLEDDVRKLASDMKRALQWSRGASLDNQVLRTNGIGGQVQGSNLILGDNDGLVQAYTPAAVGLTTPVYGTRVGYYLQIGKMLLTWGYLDITSWAGQTGLILVTAPIAYAGYGNNGVGTYYRNGGSSNQGTRMVNFDSGVNLRFGNADSSYFASWEASARVILNWQIAYIA